MNLNIIKHYVAYIIHSLVYNQFHNNLPKNDFLLTWKANLMIQLEH